MKSLVIFCFTLIAIGSGAPISCPSAEDLKPCTCKRMAFGLHVICANFENNDDLIRAFKVLRDYQVQKVLLHGLTLKEVLPSDLFDGMEISEIRVEKSKLKFPQPAFTGLDESLNILNVAQHSMIKSSENFSLAKLNQLKNLNIKANPLGIITDKWLNGKIPNVETIVLDEDEIKEIESHAFAYLPHLKSISIAENRIKIIKRSMFPRPALALTKIDLSGNEIDTLPYDFFFDMKELREVILSGNDLKTLPERTWTTVWEQLDAVLLFENRLVCDNDLNWIRRLRWPSQVVGNCVEPSTLIGKTLKDVYKT